MVSLVSMTFPSRAKENQGARNDIWQNSAKSNPQLKQNSAEADSIDSLKQNSAEVIAPTVTRLELAKLAGVSCDTNHRFHTYH